jgi:hypothetical protein
MLVALIYDSDLISLGRIPRPLERVNFRSTQSAILPEIMNGRLSEPAIPDTSLLAAGLFIVFFDQSNLFPPHYHY